jgi:hypothetical protein
MTKGSPILVNDEDEAIDGQVDTSAVTEVPATPEIPKKDLKRPGSRLQTAIDTRNELSKNASTAQKSMLRANVDFEKFSDILLDIQNTERGHIARLQEMEETVQEQQNIIREHTDRMGSTEDHEVDCIAIEKANALIRVSLLLSYLCMCSSILTTD